MKRTKKEQTLHDQIVCEIAAGLVKKGWSVWAEGCKQEWNKGERLISVPEDLPLDVECHSESMIPDIYAIKENRLLIIEVETESTFDSAHTRCQLETFASELSEKEDKLVVCVPAGYKEKMAEKLREWELSEYVDVMEF